MTKNKITDPEEKAYLQGNRAAWRLMLGEVLRHLEIDDPEAGKVKWIMERMDAIAALRAICAEHGDNSWPDYLHLADVIDKHLGRYLN